MSSPVWLTLDVLLAIHDEQIAEHGGGEGIRDLRLLESALALPMNLGSYGDASVVAMVDMASGDVGKAAFAAWLAEHARA